MRRSTFGYAIRIKSNTYYITPFTLKSPHFSTFKTQKSMDILHVSTAQLKTLQSIRETLSIFSDWKEDGKMIIKRGKPTTLMIAFETDKGVFQYQINKSGAIIKMSKVTKLSGLCLESFNLSKL